MPEPQVIEAIRQFKALLLARESRQMQEMARRWLALENTLEAQISALASQVAEIRRERGSVPRSRIFELERYQLLLRQLQREVRDYQDYADSLIQERQREFGELGLRHASQAINVQGVRTSFTQLPVGAIENMVGLAGDGSPLRELLKQSWPDAADGLTQQLVRGTALGWNPRKTAREMRRGMSQGLNRALVIARTEQLRVYREANRRQFQQSGVVSGFRRLATRDDRTCPACLMADGETYELDEVLREHPQGRCAMVPDVIGMPKVEWTLGRDWFREQDEVTQESVLGKGRYKAWRDGRFDLDELVSVRQNSTWGDSVQPTPLKELT